MRWASLQFLPQKWIDHFLFFIILLLLFASPARAQIHRQATAQNNPSFSLWKIPSEKLRFQQPAISARQIKRTSFFTKALQPEFSQTDSVIWIDTSVGVLADSSHNMFTAIAATVPIQWAGHYRVMAKVWYNSGDEQKNESFYLEVLSPGGSAELPRDPNAGPYKVVPDMPGPAKYVWRDAGLFYFAPGTNTIMMHHYVKIARQYPAFMNGPFSTPESVFLDSLKLVFSPLIDGAVALTLTTPRKEWVVSDSTGLVYPGEVYQVKIQIRNSERDSLRFAKVKLHLPQWVEPRRPSFPPSEYSDHDLQWKLPNLASFDSLAIAVDARVVDGLPPGFSPLDHTVELIAPGDKNLTNNSASQRIYAFADSSGHRPRFADLELKLELANDAVSFTDQDGIPHIPAGQWIRYTLKLHNQGPDSAFQVKLTHILPSQFSNQEFSLPPEIQNQDTLTWFFKAIAPDSLIEIFYDALVPECGSLPDTLLFSQAFVQAINDTLFDNNFSTHSAIIHFANVDLGVNLIARTDTAIAVNGIIAPAVFMGNSYKLLMKLKNFTGHAGCNAKLNLRIPPEGKFLQANLAPQSITGDTLKWAFNSIDPKQSLSLEVEISIPDSLPSSPFPLTSIIQVSSPFDTLAANDRDSVTVYALENPPPVYYTDLAIDLQSVTDTTFLVNGEPMNAVKKGESYEYLIEVTNPSSHAADSFAVKQVLPEPLLFIQSTPKPVKLDSNTLTWQVPELAAASAMKFQIRVQVPQGIGSDIHQLMSQAEIISPRDTLLNNNFAADTVLVYREGDFQSDLAVRQFVKTDSFAIQGTDTLWFARPGETYSYRIEIFNQGNTTATEVQVFDHFPQRVTIANEQPAPAVSTEDSLAWSIAELSPGAAIILRLSATVHQNLASGLHRFINRVNVYCQNEPEQKRGNNTSIDTVYSVILSTIPLPLIDARPPVVSVGDSVLVRVQVPLEIQSWDIRVYFANGEIDTTFADPFLLATTPTPGVWYEVTPFFTATRLTTMAKEEQIIFELRTKDILGNRASARTSVRVRSANAFTLDRNVFNPQIVSKMAIRFKLSSRRRARLDIFDLSGQHISKLTEGIYQPDWNTFFWDGRTETGMQVGSGVYIIMLRSGEYQDWKKVIVVR